MCWATSCNSPCSHVSVRMQDNGEETEGGQLEEDGYVSYDRSVPGSPSTPAHLPFRDPRGVCVPCMTNNSQNYVSVIMVHSM